MNTDIIDENRLAQEIVIFSDKSSIQEELTRLNSHISQFLNLIQSGASPVGKKFDFIIQEMNREVNTIGSKANSTDISKCVIELKTEIEKYIRYYIKKGFYLQILLFYGIMRSGKRVEHTAAGRL